MNKVKHNERDRFCSCAGCVEESVYLHERRVLREQLGPNPPKSAEQILWEREQEYERRYHESSWDLDDEQEHGGPSKTDSTAG